MTPDATATASHGSSDATPAAPPTRRELRQFGLLVGGALVACGAFAIARERLIPATSLGAVGLSLAVAGVVAPARLARAYRAWMRLALALSRVTTPLFMAVVYFGVLTPIALVTRLAGRRAVGVAPGAPTAWVRRPPGARQSDLHRQF